MGHGGYRPGSGPRTGPSKVVRLKLDQIDRFKEFIELGGGIVPFHPSLPASFDVSVESDSMQLNLIRALFQGADPKRITTARLSGNSMIKAGIHDGDVAVIDTKAEFKSGDIVAVVVDGELTAKRLSLLKGRKFLVPENDDLEAREVTPFNEIHCSGVILTTFRSYGKTNIMSFAE